MTQRQRKLMKGFSLSFFAMVQDNTWTAKSFGRNVAPNFSGSPRQHIDRKNYDNEKKMPSHAI